MKISLIKDNESKKNTIYIRSRKIFFIILVLKAVFLTLILYERKNINPDRRIFKLNIN